MRLPLSLAEVNELDASAFADTFGDVAEHSPWVAEAAASSRPFSSREALIEAFAAAILSADAQSQRALILAHPDLAGKAAVAGDVTADSAREQAGAGLGALKPDEFATLSRANADYRERFGFPFILAVRNASKHDILAAFERRLPNTQDAEFAEALAQICRIVRFRLEDRVAP